MQHVHNTILMHWLKSDQANLLIKWSLCTKYSVEFFSLQLHMHAKFFTILKQYCKHKTWAKSLLYKALTSVNFNHCENYVFISGALITAHPEFYVLTGGLVKGLDEQWHIGIGAAGIFNPSHCSPSQRVSPGKGCSSKFGFFHTHKSKLHPQMEEYRAGA